MNNFTVYGWSTLNETKREEVLYKLNFIKGVEVVHEPASLTVSYPEPNEAHVLKRVEEILQEARSTKEKVKTIFVSASIDCPCSHNVFEELVTDGHVGVYRDGLVSLGQDISLLMEYFDDRFKELADSFGAEHHTYPTLIPTSILERCNYFQSFPQYVNFVTHLDEDNELYETFGEDFKKRERGVFRMDDYFKKVECALSPAVCYHCYNRFENSRVDDGKGKVVAAKGKCFRYESGNMRTLERLWDFTMREIIFIGTLEHVTEKRIASIRYISEFVDELGLCGHIEVASDHFFTNSIQKKTYQLGFELKYEIRLRIPFENKTIAVGSFNIHEDFFGKTFNISTADGSSAYTGCTGFGLERWVYAFLSQYGKDWRNWPADVRSFIESRTKQPPPAPRFSHGVSGNWTTRH